MKEVKFVKAVWMILFLTVMMLFPATLASAEITVEHNVMKVLAFLKLEKCIVIYERKPGYVKAKPASNADGTINNCLLQHILESRAQNKGEWFHDNVFLSRLQKNGRHSYRQTSRPSLHVIFSFKSEVLTDIILDVDKYPPSGKDPKGSFRHALLEIIPHLIFRTKTDSEKMSASLDRLHSGQ